MKQAIKRIVPRGLERVLRSARFRIPAGFAERSYSQEGEDMVLRRLFEGQDGGFYVDIGAHHPRRFSNTFYFYRRGWRGINVEPNPDASPLFRSQRRHDINLTLGIGDTPETLTYFRFNEPALNTFDADVARSRQSEPYFIVDTLNVPVHRLDSVLQEHLPVGTPITFLSVDVEGVDLAVLRSNDWLRFRPRCVLVEALSQSLAQIDASPMHRFMIEQQYVLFAKTVHTVFYLDGAASD